MLISVLLTLAALYVSYKVSSAYFNNQIMAYNLRHETTEYADGLVPFDYSAFVLLIESFFVSALCFCVMAVLIWGGYAFF